MSWQLPRDPFDLGSDDQLMMQEILELLAMDSSNISPDQVHSTARSCTDPNNRHDLVGTEFNRNSADGSSSNESLNGEMKQIVDLSSADDVEASTSWGYLSKETSSPNSSGDNASPAGQRAVQQKAESTVGQQLQMQDSMPNPLMPLAHDTSTRLLMSRNPSYATTEQVFAGDPQAYSAAITTKLLPVSVPVQGLIASEVVSSPRDSSAFSEKQKSPSTSNVLSTGQHVHVLNSAEFNELRRKLRMQTASRRYRKRRKEQIRHQKIQVQELQAELARLHEYESQEKQYQQRSVTYLQNELEMHENEVTSLTEEIQDAAKEELDWVKLMSDHLRKTRDSTES